MTAATITTDTPDELAFAKSESKPLGMHGPLMDKLRDNAPRVVGAMKLIGITMIGLSLDPILIGCAAFFITAQLIGMAYGTKAHQQKLANEKMGSENEQADGIGKVFKPRKYPVESATGLAAVGEVFHGAYGVNADIPTTVVSAALGFAGCMLILFGKEKGAETSEAKSSPLVFAQSNSKPIGFFSRVTQYVKDNPVRAASAIMIAACVVSLAGALTIGGAAVSSWYIAGMSFGLAANIIQAAFVTKKGFNVEGATEQKQPSHQDRLAERRDRDKDMGLQPA